ncbi:MAG: MFS transporter [Nitriliruptor sp.]|nr:MAG: MFS transporter [Nitriliruptor sp.]
MSRFRHGRGGPPPAVAASTATAVVLLAASTLTVMAPTIVAPALPSIAREFASVPGADLLVPLVLTLPALVIAVTASAAGALVDRIGRRPVLVAGVVLYGAAGGTGLIAGSLTGLLAGRVGLGLAVAAALTSVTTLIADLYSGRARSRMLARQAAVMGASGTVFTITSGLLAGVGWRWSFALYPVAWLLLPAVLRVVPEPPRVGTGTLRRADVVPGPGTVSPVSVSVAAADAAPAPTGDRGALGVITVSIALLALVQVVFYLLPVQLPFLLEETFGLGPAATGAFIAIPPLAYAGASLISGRLSSGRRRASVVAVAFGVTGTGYLAIGLAGNLGVVAPGLLIGGAGLGLIVPNLVGWVAHAAPARLRGRLIGMMTSALFLGQFASPLVWSPVVGAAGRQPALTAAGLTLLGLGISALLLDALRRVWERAAGSG